MLPELIRAGGRKIDGVSVGGERIDQHRGMACIEVLRDLQAERILKAPTEVPGVCQVLLTESLLRDEQLFRSLNDSVDTVHLRDTHV